MSAGRFVARVLTPAVLLTWAVLLVMLVYSQATRPDPGKLPELLAQARSEANEAASIAVVTAEGRASTHYTKVAAEALRERVIRTRDRLRTLRGVTGLEGRQAADAAAAAHDVARSLNALSKTPTDRKRAGKLVPLFETAFKDVPK